MHYSCGVPAGSDQPVSYAQDLASRYKSAHNRLMGPPPKQRAPLHFRKIIKPAPIYKGSELSPDPVDNGAKYKINQLLRWVAQKEAVPVRELLGRRKDQRVADPRKIFYYLAYVYTGKTFAAIARYCNRDHTTVIDGFYNVCKLIKSDQYWSDHVRSYTDPLDQQLKEVNPVCPFCGGKKAAPVA